MYLRDWLQSVTGQYWVLETSNTLLQAGSVPKGLVTVCYRTVLGLRDWLVCYRPVLGNSDW